MYRRKPAVAGAFYPSNPKRLGSMIDGFMQEAKSAPAAGDVVGVVSPHAGYIYSGPVAAYSFTQINPETSLAIVLAPSHRARFNGGAVLPEGVYETPLGDVTIDAAVGGVLAGKKPFALLKEAHELEHSLEVQVPFLQKRLGEFSIVPVIVGTVDLGACMEIARGLHECLAGEKRRLAVVISTDLSHYHSYEEAKVMDGRFMKALESFDEKSVMAVIDNGKAEACGEGPVIAGMALCRLLGAGSVRILKYANSGDTAGSRDQVVGYLAAAFVR
ncbi:MAG TPA: AmmeMemoRadiSam system protein B [Spirochaetota bacterium]|nr:AmmeMemoRadiSam system protein B [Spirochaetota bacterium]HOD16795.1 AmmeMemoRadiSam system protein B [Spirochaetota bacterium]HPG50555.1 AmmeMemoRadiSam system protein B [Spirochaetota bacterium]HPN11417.1 AmmeMemoRadiSam system protein B [Spirochaetota bacterium]HQL83874.1 AmmeMemoRadiSam system protein B [Spirochaetota bacterium]